MRLNKSLQYAILLVLYLCRAGRAPLKAIALGLSVSLSLLRGVVSKLITGGVIKSIRGPGGGYEVNGEPSMRDVFQCIYPVIGISESQMNKYKTGQAEHRALAKYVAELQIALAPILRCKVKTLNNTLVAKEMARLNGHFAVQVSQ